MGGSRRAVPSIHKIASLAALMLACALPRPAFAQLAQLSDLSDVSFGTIVNVTSDVSQSQTVCAYSNALFSNYTVRATGSGAGGAFTLASGAATLAYEVQWNSAANQSGGTQLTAGVSQSGFISQGVTPGCTLGLTRSGSMTVILRAAALSAAQAGSYSGTLTLMISPN
ncbi:hypothetical protein SAMIE_1002630 [Sphingobium amiense]|uniref:Spore coat protein U domain-containing protein n=1 Tax=Sphingobium amiense TaxID=135719 RepID=A0A494W8P9_9SPHN|nr:hypothetical protein [Sphingobium amiense]BBD96762.1 hypothetical protein SAMIE_1002630 [Sphingobium amiense]